MSTAKEPSELEVIEEDGRDPADELAFKVLPQLRKSFRQEVRSRFEKNGTSRMLKDEETDLEAFYEEELKEILVELAEIHYKMKNAGKGKQWVKGASQAALVVFPLVALAYLIHPIAGLWTFIIGLLVMTLGVRMGFVLPRAAELNIFFKAKLLPRLFAHFFDEVRFDPFDGPSPEQIDRALLIPAPVRGVHSEGKIHGRIGKLRFECSEASLLPSQPKVRGIMTKAQRERNRITQMYGMERPKGYVSGLIFKAEFPKGFQGITLFRPNEVPGWTIMQGKGGKLSRYDPEARKQTEEGRELEPVNLEDPEFEKAYSVFSTDQLQARSILTPNFMERIKDFDRKWGDKVFMSFRGQELLIAVHTEKRLLRPHLDVPIGSRQRPGKLFTVEEEVERFTQDEPKKDPEELFSKEDLKHFCHD